MTYFYSIAIILMNSTKDVFILSTQLMDFSECLFIQALPIGGNSDSFVLNGERKGRNDNSYIMNASFWSQDYSMHQFMSKLRF